MTEAKIVLVGPSNLDMYANALHQWKSLEYAASIRFFAGGTCRNVAENLARIGVDTTLVTPLGDDLPGRFIEKTMKELGAKLLYEPETGFVTPTYAALVNGSNLVIEMIDSGSVKEWLDTLSWDQVRQQLSFFDAIVVTTDLPDELFYAIAGCCSKEEALLVVVISAIDTVHRLSRWLTHVDVVVMNSSEARKLLGHDLAPESIVDTLISLGPRYVVVTDGSAGAFFGEQKKTTLFFPPTLTPEEVVNPIGAGDALSAGFLYAILAGQSLKSAARIGMAAAALSTACSGPVNPRISRELLLEMAVQSAS